MSIRIKNMDALSRALQQFPLRVQQNAAKRAVRQGVNVLRDEARQTVRRHSGKLAASIKTTVSTRGNVTIGRVRLKGEHAFIGRFIEYGVTAHFIRAGAKKGEQVHSGSGDAMKIGGEFVTGTILHPGFAPRPFMRPALDSKGSEAADAVRASLAAWLSKGMPTAPDTTDDEE
ncbi:HK97-gp10 family putative phage morphogenesis protein [Caenibius sp. WL]|uniref:HK97-gp10 family putative phage morphogenesis protein n=1 Tax=Caenibius sp. WL TaxID=2872646 RepID=UPI001C9A2A55|nr:HK97-gp10 family putative phage morphogenesis protein [Caenibius sp. WL]QZP08197.1 HK97 gp10 family phage protein [Caenibius sp. WL]